MYRLSDRSRATGALVVPHNREQTQWRVVRSCGVVASDVCFYLVAPDPRAKRGRKRNTCSRSLSLSRVSPSPPNDGTSGIGCMLTGPSPAYCKAAPN